MSKNICKEGKQKQPGRWDEYVQKTKQDKVGGIIPTYEKFCLPQNDKRETRFRCANSIEEVTD